MRSTRLAATALAAALVLPAAAGHAQPEPAQPEPAQPEPAQLRSEMEQADAELANAQARLDVAQAALARLDAQVSSMAAELSVLDALLDAARADASAAALAARDAMDAVEGGGLVQARRAAEDVARNELASRAIYLWKHGPGAELALQVRLAGRARTSHDLALAGHVVDDLVRQSADEAGSATRRLRQVIAARNVSSRDEARRMAFDVAGELAQIETLERQRRALANQLTAARSEQATIVAALAGDRDVLAALATELRRTLARVSLAGALVPPADLPLDGPPPPWVDLLPSAGHDWAKAVEAIALRNGLDGALFTALVWSESGFHATAVSRAGAIGLAQLMPGTAAGLGVDPWNPWENLDGGARYLRFQIERFGRADLGLAAYNAGPGRVIDAGLAIPNIVETQLYVVRVLERWELLRGAAGPTGDG